ncbi:hypothetical protein AOZ07_16780 [Glutamicibacter halophytocola]|nr:hypothetical protein AOZ07_16780 [Glutamicibacter halophytocola]
MQGLVVTLNLPRLQAYADCNLMMSDVDKTKNQPFRLEISENEQSIQFIEVLLMVIGCCSRKKFFCGDALLVAST